MKITKEARQLSRKLFRMSFTEEKLDRAKVSSIVQSVLVEKPRHYLGALEAFQRLLRLELAKHHVVIESAAPLSGDTGAAILSNLKQKYGERPHLRVHRQPGVDRRHAHQARQRRLGRQRARPPRQSSDKSLTPLAGIPRRSSFPNHLSADRP